MCGSYRIWDSYDDQIDSAPDFYSINAPGFRDQFYLNKQNGAIKGNFLNFHDSKILSSFNLNPILNCSQFSSDAWGNSGSSNVLYENSSFKLKHENGYTYTFDKSESSSTREYPGTYISVNGYEVNTWYLTKIESPYNNKSIVFEYEDYTNNYEHLALQSLGDLNVGNYNVSNDIQIGSSSSNQFTDLYLNSVTTTKVKPKRLKTIISNENVIEFKYSTTRLDYAGETLSTIEVKDLSGRNIKTISFNHSYFSSNCGNNYECQRLKLTSMNDSSIGTYYFNYDNNIFPPRNSSKVDFLGYFNNNSSNITFARNNTQVTINGVPLGTNNGTLLGSKIYFYPYLQMDNFLPFKLSNYTAYAITDGIDRTPNQYSKLGMLERITYPTGGGLNIVYENDDFIYEGAKYLLGSLRIKSLDLRDENNNIISKTSYNYINENGTSSGQINFIKPPTNIVKSEISSGVSLAKNSVIGYSRIVHKTENKGKIEKRFSNFNDYPDVLMKIDQNITNIGISNFIKFFKFPASYVQSKDNRRGVLLEEKIYIEGNSTPVKIITNQYNYSISDSIKVQKKFTEYTDTNHPTGHYTASNYLLRHFNNIKSTKISENFNGSLLTSESQFQYQKARLTYKKTISGGDNVEEFYRNAKDKSIQKLIDANILDENIEVEMRKNGKLISKTVTKYENVGNVLPSSVLSYNLQNTPTTEITYDRYDLFGNLIQYTKDGIPVSIIWGYRNTKPIAKIIGATYSQLEDSPFISGIVSASGQDANDPTREGLLISALDNFRKNFNTTSYQITTYSYDPLIGVTSITPPSGIRENYKYDTANRLKQVEDLDNKAIEEYNYNIPIRPINYYNVEKSQTFKRNCGSGYLGSSFIYTVPAYKYSSLLSQADADQKAQNEINTNGQNAANSNGNCSSVYCPLSFNTSSGFNGGGNATPSSNDYYKVYIGYSTGPNSTTLPWSTGVKVATINGICKPKADHSSYNGQVYYTIKANGDIYIKPHQGTIPPNNTSYNYELYFPVN